MNDSQGLLLALLGSLCNAQCWTSTQGHVFAPYCHLCTIRYGCACLVCHSDSALQHPAVCVNKPSTFVPMSF
jgi:hypothetical protein